MQRTNATSSLQVHSILYRFHPSVRYDTPYPGQKEIRQQIVSLWRRYSLENRTVFDTPVKSVRRNKDGRWVINDDESKYGSFDGVVVAVGVSGDPKVPLLRGHDKFKGPIFHSSELDGEQAMGKNVVIIGGGASALEALEFAVQSGASRVDILSRSEKWVIPRNIFVQVLLASNIWGQEVALAWIPEWLLKKFFYRDLDDIVPSRGLYTESPLVNTEIFNLIRAGKATWRRGDAVSIEEHGVRVNRRAKDVPKGGPGVEEFLPANIIILATGWMRPSLRFLPPDAFEDPYGPPNWYLQVFPPKHPDICAINSTYINAIASAGHLHIGIYTRFLLAFIMDPLARPTEGQMKTWIDFTRFCKRFSPRPAFDFLTYAELLYWCVFVLVVNPFRWKWVIFVLTGKGEFLPKKVVEEEDLFRKQLLRSQH